MSSRRFVKIILCVVAVLVCINLVYAGQRARRRPAGSDEIAQLDLWFFARRAGQGEDAADTLEDDQLVFRNTKTLDFLAKGIYSATNVEDITDATICATEGPIYYFGDVNVGSDLTFIWSYQGKTFALHLGYPYKQKLSRYVTALKESSPRYGIDTID